MQLSGAPLVDTGPLAVAEMKGGEVLRLSPTGVSNPDGHNVCWVAPVIHLLIKDAVLSDFLLSKDTHDEPTNLQSQLLVLVDQFQQHKESVNLEDLLDALAQSFEGSSRRLLSRLTADGRRKAVQIQLEWSEAAQLILEALTSSSVSTDDDQMVWISMFQFLEQNFYSCGIAQCKKTVPLGASQPSWVLHLPIQQNMSLDAALERYFFGTDCAAKCSSCEQFCVHECARLCRLPVTLLINVRRATKWVKTGAVKSTAGLRYPMELPLAKFCTKGALEDKWGSVYSLKGVVLHYGSDGNKGHYMFLQRQPTGNWLLFNDAEAPVSKSPAAVLQYHELVCGLVYSRSPTKRDTDQGLYSQLPFPWLFGDTESGSDDSSSSAKDCDSHGSSESDMALGKLPKCVTALTTLPALGTPKHKLTPSQLADLESKQAEVVAQRAAAAQLKAEQAEREAELRRQKEKDKLQRAKSKVDNARKQMMVVEARKLQKAAQEQAALEQQKKAARAAQDAARAKAAATEAETRVSQTEALDDEAAPPPMSKKARAQARLAARRVELSEKKIQQAASAAAAQQLIKSQAAAQKATVEAPSVDAAAPQQLFSGISSAEAAPAATQEGADKAQQELAAEVAEVAAQAMIKAAEVVKAAQQQLEAASGEEHTQIAESSLRQMKADASAATQKEAALTAEVAQRQIVANDAAAAAAKEPAETAEAAHQQMAADAAAARREAAETAEAAQRKIQADAAKAAAQTAEAAQRQMVANAAAAAAKEAALTSEAAQRQMVANDAAAAAKEAAVTAEVAQRQIVANDAAAAAKETAQTAEAAQQQIVANASAAVAKEAAVTAEAAQQQMAASAAAAPARKGPAKTAAAAQQELQANAVAAAEMQTAEAAGAVQQKPQAEAAELTEPAACAQRQPVDRAAEHAEQEAAKCAATLEKAVATAGLQTQLDAAAAARTWKVEQLHTTGRLSTIEQPGSQLEQVHAGSFDQEVKEAALVADQHTYKKRPSLLTRQLDTAAEEAAVDVAHGGCAPAPFQPTCIDADDLVSAYYTQHALDCTAQCPMHTDMAELAAASAGQLATVQQASLLNQSASANESLSVDSSDQLCQQNCEKTNIHTAKADLSNSHSTEQPGTHEQQTEQAHAGSLEQEVKEATVTAGQQRFRKEADLLLGTAAEETAVKSAHEGSTPASCNCTCTDAIELISAFYSDHDADHTAPGAPGHTNISELVVDSRGQLAIVQQASLFNQSASADESLSVGSSDQLRQQNCDTTSIYPAKADLSISHSSADEQTLTPISANSGAEKQVTASLQAPHVPQDSMSSMPATTSPSKAVIHGNSDATEAATAVLVAPKESASHGSHDKIMSPILESAQPGATSCCGSGSSDSYARAGSSQQHDANSGSPFHERTTPPANANAEASSSAQAPDAEELFAAWHGRPAPSQAPPHPKQQFQTHPKRGFFRKVLHGARKVVQELDRARQQHPYQVAALGIAAGVALAATVTLHHKDTNPSARKDRNYT